MGFVPRLVLSALLVALAAALVAVTAVAFFWGLGDLGLHGTLALALAVFGVAALAVGLMGLLAFSHRRGFDEAAHRFRPPRRPGSGPDRNAGGRINP
ncbi:MAG: hypothetical protein HY521_14025 [Proteobacteria bacterium]|nr:hypothetical protein [Pseudomonadota bacterium]